MIKIDVSVIRKVNFLIQYFSCYEWQLGEGSSILVRYGLSKEMHHHFIGRVERITCPRLCKDLHTHGR